MSQALYQDYFGIAENPFSIIPDPHYLFMSPRHREALAHVLFGVGESGGFVLLTGEVGTGKTTICRTLIEQLPDNVDLALILNPKLTEIELLATICDEMRVVYPRGANTVKNFIDFINRHLLRAHAQGRNPVLMIDEAQALSPGVLELIRLLTNLETKDKKLLQIILVGQPELLHILAKPEMRQTAQRITARYHLSPLGLVETRAYVLHRLKVAGLQETLFSNGAIKAVHVASRGIPRLINSICDRCLLAAYAKNLRAIDARLAKSAAREVLGEIHAAPQVWRRDLLLASLVAALVVFVTLDPMNLGLRDRIRSWVSPPPTVAATAFVEPVEAAPIDEFPAPAETVAVPPPPTAEGALTRLFALWDLDFTALTGFGPCEKAESAGLQCIQGRASIANLRAMNRPAVASLADASGTRSFAVVTAVRLDGVALVTGDETRDMALSDFTDRWTGEYVLIWRLPAVFTRDLRIGLEGDDVLALRRLLTKAGHDGGDETARKFDETVKTAVQALQARAGLSADGIVGKATLLFLTGMGGETALPALVPTAE
ncbi:MAG: AAA family ATPase [Alphaproteobacteria bacterium]|nr:AAA family ATPase [Alphaproteobacteria bacterium]